MINNLELLRLHHPKLLKKKWLYLKPARQGQKILRNYFEHSISPTSVEAERAFSSLFANNPETIDALSFLRQFKNKST
jgi:hypothetical protein